MIVKKFNLSNINLLVQAQTFCSKNHHPQLEKEMEEKTPPDTVTEEALLRSV